MSEYDSELGTEASEADIAEQHTDVFDAEQPTDGSRELPLDANEADVAEQEQPVDLGEDDYR